MNKYCVLYIFFWMNDTRNGNNIPVRKSHLAHRNIIGVIMETMTTPDNSVNGFVLLQLALL